MHCICNSCKFVTLKNAKYYCSKTNKTVLEDGDYELECNWWPPVTIIKENINERELHKRHD